MVFRKGHIIEDSKMKKSTIQNIAKHVSANLGTASAVLAALMLAVSSITCGGGGGLADLKYAPPPLSENIPVVGVSLDKSSMALTVDQSETLVATVLPSIASNKAVSWSSSNTNVATVGEGGSNGANGVVRAIAAGTATITARTSNGVTATCAVTVGLPAFASIAAGQAHSVALGADGGLWAWGRNDIGQLGDGTRTDRYSPVQVGTARNWKSVAAGLYHTVALRTDGTLWAWGRNDYGELGLGNSGSDTNRNVPVQVDASRWAAVATGDLYTVALKTDGSLWAWGRNEYGQLGDGTNRNRNSPVQVGTARDWTAIAAGLYHTVALRTDGTLWAWGRNEYGQLGDGTNTNRNSPVQVGTARDWTAIAAGQYHTLALNTNCILWVWGSRQDGTAPIFSPVQITGGGFFGSAEGPGLEMVSFGNGPIGAMPLTQLSSGSRPGYALPPPTCQPHSMKPPLPTFPYKPATHH
jgi:hypothetical protein